MNTNIAQLLLDIDAVHYYKDEPYRFTSGTLSPVYVDCRRVISFPSAREPIIESALDRINALSGPKPQVIAGGETAGIPYAAIIADHLRLPMIYIRKKPKEFGTKSRIEGKLEQGQTVLLVEDLIFDAQSKLSFADAIREAGGLIANTLVIFEYGRESARAQLTAAGLNLISLTSWAHLLDLTVARGTFTVQQADTVRRFLADPKSWMDSGQIG